MERDFESEFRELKQNEVPDLWNRIESALPEKKITTALPKQENPAADANRYVPKKRMAWKNWGILIAACFCIVVLFPVVITRFADTGKSGSSDTSASYAGSSDTAMAEEENGFADAAGDATFGQMEEGGDAAAAEGISGGTTAADADMADGAAGTNTTDNMAGEAAGSAQNTENSGAASKKEEAKGDGGTAATDGTALEDGQVLEGVVVEITKAETWDTENIYTAYVEQGDENGLPENGAKIAIVCNSETQYDFPRTAREEQMLKAGKQYIVTLQFDAMHRMTADGEGVLTFYGLEVDARE